MLDTKVGMNATLLLFVLPLMACQIVSDARSPSEVAQDYYWACNEADYSGAKRLLNKASREFVDQYVEVVWEAECDVRTNDGRIEGIQVQDEEIRTGRASVELTITFDDGTTNSVHLDLTQQGTAWRISL